LLVLAVMGAILLPLGLLVFVRIEAWAKKTGKLKRTG
jgi:ABC-2 type transport system permease protein